MNKTVYRALSVISVFAAVAIAYSFEFSVMEDTRARVESINRTSSGGRIEPLPEFTPRIQVTFDEIRDPFETGDSETDPAMSGSGDRDMSLAPSLKLKPGDLSLLGREAGRALVKLPDGAVYLVEQGDSLWGGDATVQEIGQDGVTIKYTPSNRVEILEKFSIR